VFTTPYSRAPVSGAAATFSMAASLTVVEWRKEGERKVDVRTVVHEMAVGSANEMRVADTAKNFMAYLETG